ncbi:MAG: hypothetical protein AMXMBFR46_16100 [Acidimicrobiia bacterium]
MTGPRAAATVTVTVVVPARDAAATIDAQLAALAAQDFEGPFEVIVADNGSTDDTAARARAWADRIPVLRVVDASSRPGPAHARNVGVAAASADRVLCCDADDIADRAWVRRLAGALDHADAVAGGTVELRGSAPSAAAEPRPFGTAGFGFLPGLIGASCGFRRPVWAAVGGFDESYPTCEDLAFAWTLQLHGCSLVQEPDGFVHYRRPSTPSVVLRTWYRYGRYQPLLMREFGPAGLRREPLTRVLAGWSRIVLRSYRLLGGDDARREWLRDLGRRAGRVVGSVRTRTLYL